MRDRFQEAFDQIHAEKELKDKTKAVVAQKMRRHAGRGAAGRFSAAFAVAYLLLVLAGGWVYFTPTAEISIDINPSIELGINRFDKVISATGYNEDGRELAASADVKFMDYAQAVERILSSESITKLLSQGEAVTIAVVGPNVEQRGRMLSDMESCTAGQRNAYCYSADPEEVAAAHGMGLSYGKYRAFLEAQALDPGITPEKIRDMSMREIRDLIAALSPDGPGEQDAGGGQGGGWQKHGHNGRSAD